MKKKIYLWTIGIVTAVCMVSGIIHHILQHHILQRSAPAVEQTVNLEAFDRVRIEVDTIQVDVAAGAAYELQYSGNEVFAPDYEIKDGVLVIEQGRKRSWWILKDSKNPKLCLTIPASAALQELDITSDIGEVRVAGACFERGSITSDIGAVAVKDCDFKSLEITSDIGAIEAQLLGAEEDYTMGLFTEIGEIEIDHNTVNSQYIGRGNTDKELKITTDIGAIEVEFETKDFAEK